MSLNCTNILLLPGANGIVPDAAAKIEKVGVALALIVALALGPAGDRQAAVTGFV